MVSIIMVTMYTCVFTDKARKQYEVFSGKMKRQMDRALERITKHPELGKPLVGRLKGIWSERVSTFRILYHIDHRTAEVIVLVIDHRSRVYGGSI